MVRRSFAPSLPVAAAVAAAAAIAAAALVVVGAAAVLDESGGAGGGRSPGAFAFAAAASDGDDDGRDRRHRPRPNPLASLLIKLLITSDSMLDRISASSSVLSFVSRLNTFLDGIGVPSQHQFLPEEVVLYVFATLVTLLMYFVAFGKRHGRQRRDLTEDLRVAQLQVHYLEEKLLEAKAQDLRSDRSLLSGGGGGGEGGTPRSPFRRVPPPRDEVRIFMDGAFDMMHYGHMNAFRLGRSLGTRLIVGINSDESIAQCKGAPLMNDRERLTMVQGCKFVDEVVPGCPYVMNAKYLDYVIEKFRIDYVVHGDDPCIVDGKDVYAAAKEAGKYQSIPRTEGVSTTDIVGRMLTMTKEHHFPTPTGGDGGGAGDDASVTSVATGGDEGRPLCELSKFLTTSRMLRLFSTGMKAPEKGMRVIYMDGAWDMFHCGHVAVLKKAKQRGDYLVVGVHGDAVVNRVRGSNLPLMNLHERVLSVMGCRYVDDVLIDAPFRITPEMVASLNISEVVHGSRSDDVGEGFDDDDGGEEDDDDDDEVKLTSTNGDGGDKASGQRGRHERRREGRYGQRYRYPIEAGIFTVVPSPTDFSMGSILDRIRENQEVFQAKIGRKKRAESEYYEEKYKGKARPKGGTVARKLISGST